MISWLWASACLFALVLSARPGEGPPRDGGTRKNEVSLARLRPGKDSRAVAISLYGSSYRRVVPDADDIWAWVDRRQGRVLRIEVDDRGTIESVTISAVDSLLSAAGGPEAGLPPQMLRTGLGLSLGQVRGRVFGVYGPPASRGPSTEGGRELELFFYSFDWAGSDVPQAMEVTCERSSGRVVQITLASPSL